MLEIKSIVTDKKKIIGSKIVAESTVHCSRDARAVAVGGGAQGEPAFSHLT